MSMVSKASGEKRADSASRRPAVEVRSARATAPALQRALGNHAFGELLTAPPSRERDSGGGRLAWPIQRKLRVGPSGDALEQEADAAADRAVRPGDHTDTPRNDIRHQGDEIQRKSRTTAEPASRPQTIRVRSAASRSFEPGHSFETRLNPGAGSPLPANTRAVMETRLGANFSGVRIHSDDNAAELSQEIGARAFTHGSDIYFGKDSPDLGSTAGRHLLAHELTHTIQQGAAKTNAPGGEPSSFSLIQRNGKTPADDLDQRYRSALGSARETGNWQAAAEHLNGFNREDIQSRLAELSDQEVGYLHRGALDNPRVGPEAQVAILTRPGVPRASTLPAAAASTPPEAAPEQARAAPQTAPAPARRTVADMSATEKLVEAFHRAKINQAVRNKILSLFTPQALVAAIISFAVVFVASQFTPVGWAADLGLALTALFIGTAVFTALKHLVNFAEARNATSDPELDQAGEEFAEAVAEVEIDAILAILTHGFGGAEGGVPYEGPPPPALALATNRGGAIVAVASNTITAEEAARLGLKGAAAVTNMMSQMQGGPGGGTGPQQTPQASPQQSSSQGPVQSASGPKGASKGVEIVDAGGKPLGEFDEIQPDRFIEDKSARGLNTPHPRTGKPVQTPDEWAQKQIFDKTVVRLDNLAKNAARTRTTPGGSTTIPTLAEIQTIRQLEFRIEASTPELQVAVEKQIKALSAKYPGWNFGATYGP